jgi:hypothetical protein
MYQKRQIMLENDYFCFNMKPIDHSNPLVVHNKNKLKSLTFSVHAIKDRA